jgi:hypothetical protein
MLKHVCRDFILVQPRQAFKDKVQFYVVEVFVENRLALPLVANRMRGGNFPICSFESDTTMNNHVNITIRTDDEGEAEICRAAEALHLPIPPMLLVKERRRI